MKKSIPAIVGIGLLLISGCASPASTATPVATMAVPKPTATSIPLSETPAQELSELPGFGVPYIADGSPRQKLDVYLPEGEDGPFPTIFAIHGGGFSTGSKVTYNELASHFNELGYALVSIDYRLTPDFNYPAQVQDSFCALAWVHANAASYGFDTERIIVMGESTGGYLAAMLGTVDTQSLYLEGCPNLLPRTDWIQGALVFYGHFDFTSIDGYTDGYIRLGLQPYWGVEFSEIPPDTLAEMSPLSWVDGSEPPFLLIHGTSDIDIPSWMSEDFASALEESGAAVELLLLEAGHGFFGRPSLSSPTNVQSLETVESWLAALFER
jgi:acetyl esterase/lipase